MWDVLPSFQKSVAACDDMPTLAEQTKAFIDHLTKRVFPDKEPDSIPKDPQDTKLENITNATKKSTFIEQITTQAEQFEETYQLEATLLESKKLCITQEKATQIEMWARMQKAGLSYSETLAKSHDMMVETMQAEIQKLEDMHNKLGDLKNEALLSISQAT